MKKLSMQHPKLTLSDIYNNDVVYTARPSYVSNPWLNPEEHQSNFLTGRELIIADQIPVIVHEANVTDKLKILFDTIGKTMPTNIYTFYDQQSYEQMINKLAKQDRKRIYFQYIHNESILEQKYYAIDKDVFVALNNKARIPEWTNHKYLPARDVVNICDFEDAVSHWRFPFVVKPGDDLPTAGGYGVMICYNESDLTKAKSRIAEAQEETHTLIIEQKIEEIANYCVQFAYEKDEGIRYIGTSEQLTDEYGHYNGNENVHDVPESIIQAGREIMEIGVSKGFIGIAGFDLLLDKNGDIFAIDLNFRQNGSTSMLLLEPVIQDGYQKFYSYIAPDNNEHFFNTILKYVKNNHLFPLAYYDGDWYENGHVSSRCACIWHGKDKKEVACLEQQFLNELKV